MYRLLILFSFIVCGTASLVAQNAHDDVSHSQPSRAKTLKRLVLHDCGSCHGMTLKGGLGPDIRAATLKGTSPLAIAQIILNGVPGTPMPPWRELLSEDDAKWIAEYLLNEDRQ